MPCPANHQTYDRDRYFSYPTARRLMADRESGRDCVSQMRLLRSRPDILANALREMGITEDGDGLPDPEE